MAVANADAGAARHGLAQAAATRAGIDHPNLLGAGLARDRDGRLSVRLERCLAPTLTEVLSRRTLSTRDAVRMVNDVASAVHVLSLYGLIARDLTPGKIRLHSSRGAILADHGIPFELAPRRPSEARRDLAYRSPEELDGKPVDERSYVYSLGAVLYTALTGKQPLTGRPGVRASGGPVELRGRVASVVQRAMATDPADRYADVRELADAGLAALAVDSAPGTATRRRAQEPQPVSPPKRPARPQPRSRPPHETRPELEARPEPKPKPAATPRPRAEQRQRAKPRQRAKLPKFAPPEVKLPQPSRPDARKPDATARQVERAPAQRPAVKREQPVVARERPVFALPASKPPAVKRPQRQLPAALTSPRPAVFATAAALVVCAIAGVLLGRSTGEEAQASQVQSRALTVPLPEGWEPAEVPAGEPFDLSAAVAAAPAGDESSGLVVGRVPGAVAVDGRLRNASAPANARADVRLGELQAWRYEGLTPRPDTVATAYLAPTTGGTLLIRCHAGPQDAATRLAECERMAATIALRGERPLPLSTIDSRDEELAAAMTSLSRDRDAGRQRLARAELARGQADVARDLERAYDRAARRVGRILTTNATASYQELTGALTATADAYGRLAVAAKDTNRSRYRKAISAVRESEQAVLREATDPDAG